MILAYLNGIVLEIGRKVRNEKEEEDGVETYSKIFGKKNLQYFYLLFYYFNKY